MISFNFDLNSGILISFSLLLFLSFPLKSDFQKTDIIGAIERSERRKMRVKAVERRIEEASQMWWREVRRYPP